MLRALWSIFALLCALQAVAQEAVPAASGLLHFDSALSVEGGGSRFPDAPAVRRVSLPDDWARTRPGVRGPVWYRVAFNLGERDPRQPGEPLRALYIAQVCSSLEVYLNGALVFSGGRMQEPLTHNCYHPQLVTLPAGLLLPRANTVDIKVAGHALAETSSRLRAGNLSALVLGPHDALAGLHARQTALNIGVAEAVSATLLLMGGFMFVMGFTQRRDSHLAYFGALSVGWALVDARQWLRSVPWSNTVAEFLVCALMPLITLAAVQFMLRLAKTRRRWIDIALPLQCALVPLSLVLAGPSRLYPVAMVWYAIFALQVIAAAALYLRLQWPRRTGAYWQMVALMVVMALMGASEVWCQLHGVRPPAAQWLMPLTAILFVLVGLRLVQQHGLALVEAEAGRAHLEHRIREATAEIERNFRQLSELRVEQVTERERKRIAGDLHDDLGAKLLTIVHTSESERISTLAREALEEMRLSVRGLTGKAVQLSDALGDWRAEVVSRLGQAGIEADWSAPEDLHQRLSSRAYVQTTRILREATSNIIKHSGASYCAVRCSVADGDFQLVVQDNGNGISAEVEGRLDRGHGLASMKHRAKQLDGQCLVESTPGYGTVIRLTLPMDRAVEMRPSHATDRLP